MLICLNNEETTCRRDMVPAVFLLPAIYLLKIYWKNSRTSVMINNEILRNEEFV